MHQWPTEYQLQPRPNVARTRQELLRDLRLSPIPDVLQPAHRRTVRHALSHSRPRGHRHDAAARVEDELGKDYFVFWGRSINKTLKFNPLAFLRSQKSC